ncbi:hypothetical protein CALCODRAFT_424117, partial [Calocera cornea HHB12733]
RMIRTVTQILRAVVSDDQSDWGNRLPMVEYAINASSNASTGYAPFELNYGHVP